LPFSSSRSVSLFLFAFTSPVTEFQVSYKLVITGLTSFANFFWRRLIYNGAEILLAFFLLTVAHQSISELFLGEFSGVSERDERLVTSIPSLFWAFICGEYATKKIIWLVHIAKLV
jgi:hypothetical protein